MVTDVTANDSLRHKSGGPLLQINQTQLQGFNITDDLLVSNFSNGTEHSGWMQHIILDPRPALPLRLIEYSCLAFFFIEFVVRFSVCPNKRKLLFTPVTFLDLSYVSSWILMLLILYLFPKTRTEESGYKVYAGLQALAAIRILRIFRLARYFRGLKMILLTLKASARELLLLLVCFLIAMVLFADLIRKAEHRVDEKNKFDNVFVALWWVVISMTTVGYGDIVPESPPGYAVGMACAFLGPIITSFIVPMISDHFLSYYAYKERDIRRSHTNHSNKCI
ncbi:potassium voltage-gated channel subfamily A member 10-like [Liolophura sinensis]|uniref:potassium voltage-gated channel subfamily A member 10-like n=1 Tax=Liolophura sinensis TaxID=3198878 RepID=UPI0031586F6C